MKKHLLCELIKIIKSCQRKTSLGAIENAYKRNEMKKLEEKMINEKLFCIREFLVIQCLHKFVLFVNENPERIFRSV